MAADNQDAARLLDMVEAAESISRHLTNKQRTDLDKNEMLGDALERQLEIFGEAARNISAEFQKMHPEIPWKKIISTRHILAHEYGRVNPDVLWRIVTQYVPEALKKIKPLVPPFPPDPEPEER
ncbi:MAG TPA: HepT-like ribonuclease domain-containing protein [Phycisphaerae bacterium]|nr:HepT-like ribonuclease domain-containing protein [Phycisphaerae bacterium]